MRQILNVGSGNANNVRNVTTLNRNLVHHMV
jgi:hypothetical protein